MRVKDSSPYTRAQKYTNTLTAEYTVTLTRVYITLLRCFIYWLLVPSTEYLETSPVARQSIVLHPLPSYNIKYSGIISAGQIHRRQRNLSSQKLWHGSSESIPGRDKSRKALRHSQTISRSTIEQVLSSKANSFLASKRIYTLHRIVYYRAPNPLVRIPNQINPIHAFSSYILKIIFNIILLSMPRTVKRFFLSGFSISILCETLLYVIKAICPAYPILPDFTTRITFGVQYKPRSSPLCKFLQPRVSSFH
jgi:hypothetical protein